MDFILGRWRTEVTRFKDPFHHPEMTDHITGTKIARAIWNGKALIEEIEAEGPGGHWEAASFYLYDPHSRQWSQNYVDSNVGHFDGAPGVGEYRNGNLEFYWQTTIDGVAMFERGVWSAIKPTSHTYEVSRSNDGGKTWHTSFIAQLTRLP